MRVCVRRYWERDQERMPIMRALRMRDARRELKRRMRIMRLYVLGEISLKVGLGVREDLLDLSSPDLGGRHSLTAEKMLDMAPR